MNNIKKIIILFCLIILTGCSNTQEVAIQENIDKISPEKIENELEADNIDENSNELLEAEKYDIIELTPTLNDVADYCGDGLLEHYKGGCSWYCGGQGDSIHPKASSHLKPQGKVTYEAKNAHDFDLSTVWSEGVDGYGIGEYLEYEIDALENLAITKIEIINGYIKSDSLWEANSRVKKMKLWKDNEPFAILLLEDSKQVQVFDIESISLKDGKKLKFEILDVYKGSKYKDVVITEIQFDGTGVH